MSSTTKTSYWINTISLNHVEAAVEGGFTQANHGSPRNLVKLRKGDYMVFYSPKTEFKGKEPLQAFTAVGRVLDDEPYQVRMSADFSPYRRKLQFMKCKPAPIQPLLADLSFIKDKTHWGLVFRRGMFEIDGDDFKSVLQAMQAEANSFQA